MIKCTCGGRTVVKDTRHSEDCTYRSRLCKLCDKVMYTVEYDVEITESFIKEWKSLERRSKRCKNATKDS